MDVKDAIVKTLKSKIDIGNITRVDVENFKKDYKELTGEELELYRHAYTSKPSEHNVKQIINDLEEVLISVDRTVNSKREMVENVVKIIEDLKEKLIAVNMLLSLDFQYLNFRDLKPLKILITEYDTEVINDYLKLNTHDMYGSTEYFKLIDNIFWLLKEINGFEEKEFTKELVLNLKDLIDAYRKKLESSINNAADYIVEILVTGTYKDKNLVYKTVDTDDIYDFRHMLEGFIIEDKDEDKLVSAKY